MEAASNIIEIFSSLQGEGPYVGSRQLFVRFEGCSLSCQFCDTPASFVHNAQCRVEAIPFTKTFDFHENPITVSQLNRLLQTFPNETTLAVTGGEPLESVAFLQTWLPTVAGTYQVLLETAGVHDEALETVLPWVDIVSMDLKLPSVTGMDPLWDAHARFLKCAVATELYVKVVVSAETAEQDILQAIELVVERDRTIPFILQSASPFAAFRSSPSLEQLAHWEDMARSRLSDVRQIPQLHKLLKVL